MSLPASDPLAAPRNQVAPFRDLYPFEPHFLDVEGGRMHYADEGPADAPPLLCIHGNPTWSFLFRRQLQSLAGPMRVVAPDHLGCGLSDQPADWPYRLEGHIRNLVRLIEQLDLDHVTLLVHDWGGAIGLGAGLRLPDRIDRLVITNTAAFPAERIPKRIAVCRVPVLGRVAVQGFNAFARAATRMAVERPMSREVRRAFVSPYASPRSARATWHFVDDIPMHEGHPSWKTLTAIGNGLPIFLDTPTLLLWGERDWCFTPAFREEFERRLPAARSVPIPDAGHYLFEDAPERIDSELRSFLGLTNQEPDSPENSCPVPAPPAQALP